MRWNLDDVCVQMDGASIASPSLVENQAGGLLDLNLLSRLKCSVRVLLRINGTYKDHHV